MASTNSIEVKADVRINGCIYDHSCCNIINEIDIDESSIKKRDGDYALKLYYAEPDEEIWEIAKKYSTSVQAIVDENELENDIIRSKKMILIPIVS